MLDRLGILVELLQLVILLKDKRETWDAAPSIVDDVPECLVDLDSRELVLMLPELDCPPPPDDDP